MAQKQMKAESWSDFNHHSFKNNADPDGICGCESQSASMGLGKGHQRAGARALVASSTPAMIVPMPITW